MASDKDIQVNDDTLFPSGEYRFTRMSKVPADYLLNFSGKKANLPKPFREYIKANLEAITMRVNANDIDPVEFICNKVVYASKIIAKIALTRISAIKQDNKKPIRSYECEYCSGWHLTSLPYDTFIEKKY